MKIPVIQQLTSKSGLHVQEMENGEVHVYGVDANGDIAGNAAIIFTKPNSLGIVFNRGEGPSVAGDPFKLDASNRITYIGV